MRFDQKRTEQIQMWVMIQRDRVAIDADTPSGDRATSQDNDKLFR